MKTLIHTTQRIETSCGTFRDDMNLMEYENAQMETILSMDEKQITTITVCDERGDGFVRYENSGTVYSEGVSGETEAECQKLLMALLSYLGIKA